MSTDIGVQEIIPALSELFRRSGDYSGAQRIIPALRKLIRRSTIFPLLLISDKRLPKRNDWKG